MAPDTGAVMTIPPRFDLSEDQIDRVVARFYAAIRRHDVLGAVFARHVIDWTAHEAKIARFWKKAILFQPGYDGNPMQVHMATTEIQGAHFALWLALFDETLAESLPEPTANAWSALAHRIGRGMRIGVEDARHKPDKPPMLR